jgi:hypothetical protein
VGLGTDTDHQPLGGWKPGRHLETQAAAQEKATALLEPAVRSHNDQVRQYLAQLKTMAAAGRRTAAALDRAEPGWHIYYSGHEQRIIALPLWNPGQCVILAHPNARALLFQMRQTEAEYARAAAGRSRASAYQLRSETGEPYPLVRYIVQPHRSVPVSEAIPPESRSSLRI